MANISSGSISLWRNHYSYGDKEDKKSRHRIRENRRANMIFTISGKLNTNPNWALFSNARVCDSRKGRAHVQGKEEAQRTQARGQRPRGNVVGGEIPGLRVPAR